MRLEIKQWGNSKAVRLPKDFTSQLNLNSGDFLELNQIDENRFTLVVVQKQYHKKRLSLSERIAMTKGELPVLKDWDTMPLVGEEI